MFIYILTLYGCLIGTTNIPKLEFVINQDSQQMALVEVNKIIREHFMVCENTLIRRLK
jgi:hypothetical protein